MNQYKQDAIICYIYHARLACSVVLPDHSERFAPAWRRLTTAGMPICSVRHPGLPWH